jgi:hypothetical protein
MPHRILEVIIYKKGKKNKKSKKISHHQHNSNRDSPALVPWQHRPPIYNE